MEYTVKNNLDIYILSIHFQFLGLSPIFIC